MDQYNYLINCIISFCINLDGIFTQINFKNSYKVVYLRIHFYGKIDNRIRWLISRLILIFGYRIDHDILGIFKIL